MTAPNPLRHETADPTDPTGVVGQADNLVKGTSAYRLAQAFRDASAPPTSGDPGYTFSSSPATVINGGAGVPNPYGRGLSAYEPSTVMFDSYQTAFDQVQNSKAQEAATKAGDKVTADFTQKPVDFAGGGIVDAKGLVRNMVFAAMNLASRRVPYVWGGTTANGVDCSGLIYYAARAAGIPWQRYRAVDYGHMGTAVSVDQARAGDIVYYDEPGDTDHVGIYIGNGQMIQAPQSGDVVKVSSIGNPTSIRRIFSDSAFSSGATPTGPAAPLYFGQPYRSTPTVTPYSPAPYSPAGTPFQIRRTGGPVPY